MKADSKECGLDSLPTAATLSRWLRDSGTLPHGNITDVQLDLEHKTDISKLFFLNATYSHHAAADLPSRLVVKSVLRHPNPADYDRAELRFYREFAPRLGTPPAVRCVAVVEDEGELSGTVVLEDVRATHGHRPWPIPPSRNECEMAIDALARVHAKWWEATDQPHTVQSLTSMVHGIVVHLPDFMDSFGNSLTADAKAIYERVFSSSLRPWLRLTDPRALTIIHGDAHSWNFLFPRSGSGAAFLIDWQLWHVDVGARDLAFLMALHWHPDRRRELEVSLLRRYHEALLAHGVTNYGYDNLWLDYRRCAVRNLTIPILFWSRGMKPEGWWHRLECALAAYRELECEELL